MLKISNLKRGCELFNLVAGIVYIKLTVNAETCPIKYACKAVAYCTATGISDMHRACRVGRYKFHKHPFALTVIALAVILAARKNVLKHI